jgi:site-specific DNA-methyltransferase (adenine-specific)
MFSFAGDTVLDPFAGTGSTTLAAVAAGRNSIANEIEPTYLDMAHQRVERELEKLRFIGTARASVSLDTLPRLRSRHRAR